jgi:hypothetical protein
MKKFGVFHGDLYDRLIGAADTEDEATDLAVEVAASTQRRLVVVEARALIEPARTVVIDLSTLERVN